MAFKVQRPILVGGIGLSFALWLLQSLDHSATQIGEFSVIGTIALITCLWLFQQMRSKNVPLKLDLPTDKARVEKAIAQAEAIITQLATEAQSHQALAPLQAKAELLTVELERQEINLAVTGGKGVGKTSLIQLVASVIPQIQPKNLQETPPLFTCTEAGEKLETAALTQANNSDVVLFLTNADLTDTEFQTLKQLAAPKERLMLVFNKQDQYLPDERATILLSLRQRMHLILGEKQVVAIAASPSPVKVRSHQPDGSVQEWMEQPSPDISQLTEQLGEIVTQQAQQLIWATTVRQAIELKAEAKTVLNQVRRDRSLPVIEQYQWIAAAAAFANPVPALDLLATAAINAQLVMELGGIYQQKFSLEQAQAVAGTMASLMLKLGLVELSTKAIATVLKSNAITFVAGGVVQGVSAAYLTRVAGISLVEYFQQQEVGTTAETGLNLDKLSKTLQNVFQQNQQIAVLHSFVKQGLGRLLPESSVVTSESIVNT